MMEKVKDILKQIAIFFKTLAIKNYGHKRMCNIPNIGDVLLFMCLDRHMGIFSTAEYQVVGHSQLHFHYTRPHKQVGGVSWELNLRNINAEINGIPYPYAAFRTYGFDDEGIEIGRKDALLVMNPSPKIITKVKMLMLADAFQELNRKHITYEKDYRQ